jgi:hypothetical protein
MLVDMIMGEGESGGFAEGLFESVGASTQHTFTTTHKAKAVWIVFIGNNATCRVITNVNPTTGAINNSDIYYDQSTNAGTPLGWTQFSGLSFNVTDNAVAPSGGLSSTATMQKILYTY